MFIRLFVRTMDILSNMYYYFFDDEFVKVFTKSRINYCCYYYYHLNLAGYGIGCSNLRLFNNLSPSIKNINNIDNFRCEVLDIYIEP